MRTVEGMHKKTRGEKTGLEFDKENCLGSTTLLLSKRRVCKLEDLKISLTENIYLDILYFDS